MGLVKNSGQPFTPMNGFASVQNRGTISVQQRRRMSRGTPAGGQFAAENRGESEVDLNTPEITQASDAAPDTPNQRTRFNVVQNEAVSRFLVYSGKAGLREDAKIESRDGLPCVVYTERTRDGEPDYVQFDLESGKIAYHANDGGKDVVVGTYKCKHRPDARIGWWAKQVIEQNPTSSRPSAPGMVNPNPGIITRTTVNKLRLFNGRENEVDLNAVRREAERSKMQIGDAIVDLHRPEDADEDVFLRADSSSSNNWSLYTRGRGGEKFVARGNLESMVSEASDRFGE